MELINDYSAKAKQLIDTGYKVKIESYLSKGFGIFRMRMDLFLIYTIIVVCLISIPFGGFLVALPLIAGFYLAADYLVNGKIIRLEDMFDGFKHFLNLFLFTLLSSILIFLGFLALILPGIYLIAGYVFAPFFIIFGRMDLWDAMEISRKVVHKEWFSIFIFILVLGLLNFVGMLALGVGLLFTIPISYCAMYAAFDDIVGINRQETQNPPFKTGL